MSAFFKRLAKKALHLNMNKQERVAAAIKEVVTDMMDRVMENVLVKDPFIKEKHHSAKPLYAALVPDEIFKGSHFERRFVTPFGSVWEKLAYVVAMEAHGNCSLGHIVTGTVGSESLRRIQEVLNRLSRNSQTITREEPNWEKELAYIKKGGGELLPVKITCDIFIDSKETNTRYAFELENPLSNTEQTRVSKEKMFKVLAMTPQQVDYAYYALPYGKNEDYKWIFPSKWFNVQVDSCVLIGDKFWNLVGGEGVYDNIIKEVNLLGKGYKELIYKELLEKEPPTNFVVS